MQVVDCLKKVSVLLGDCDIENILTKAEKFNSGELQGELLPAEEKKILKYLSAYNMAVEKMATEYLNLKTREMHYANSYSNIYFDDFDYRVVDILSVETLKGELVRDYLVLPFSISVPKKDSEYYISYRYLPNEAKTIFDEIPIQSCVSGLVLSYLICSYLTLSVSLFDESKMWESRFEKELFKSLHMNRSFSLKKFNLV